MIENLFELDDDAEFAYKLYLLISKYHQKNKDVATYPKSVKSLFLYMFVDDCTQADTIMTFYEEGYSEHGGATLEALNEIGAIKTAEQFKMLLDIMSNYDDMDNISDDDWKIISKIDWAITDYLDGHPSILIAKYARANKAELIANL